MLRLLNIKTKNASYDAKIRTEKIVVPTGTRIGAPTWQRSDHSVSTFATFVNKKLQFLQTVGCDNISKSGICHSIRLVSIIVIKYTICNSKDFRDVKNIC